MPHWPLTFVKCNFKLSQVRNLSAEQLGAADREIRRLKRQSELLSDRLEKTKQKAQREEEGRRMGAT